MCKILSFLPTHGWQAMNRYWLRAVCLTVVWDGWTVAKRCEVDVWLQWNTIGNSTPVVQNLQ